MRYRFSSDEAIVSLLDKLVIYIGMKRGIAFFGVARKINLSKEQFKDACSIGSLSMSIKESVLIKILKEFNLSVDGNVTEGYTINEEQDNEYYLLKGFVYIYIKETKSLAKYQATVDILENSLSLSEFGSDKVIVSNLDEYDNNTICNFVHYIPSYGRSVVIEVYDRNNEKKQLFRNDMRLQLYGAFHRSKRLEIFAFCSMIINNSILQSGRVLFLFEEIESFSESVQAYLTNDAMHSFYNNELIAYSIKEADAFVRNYQKKCTHIQVELHKDLSNAYQQFLSFFTEYVSTVKGEDIKFDVLKNNLGISIDINLKGSNLDMDQMRKYLNEYLRFTKTKIDDINVEIGGHMPEINIDLFVIELKRQITYFKQSLEIANLKLSYLERERDSFKNILDALIGKENKISLQLINGGDQQFADKIENRI